MSQVPLSNIGGSAFDKADGGAQDIQAYANHKRHKVNDERSALFAYYSSIQRCKPFKKQWLTQRTTDDLDDQRNIGECQIF